MVVENRLARGSRGFWAIGVVVPALGEVWPGGLRIVYLAVSYATFPIGWGVSHIILAVVYYLVLFSNRSYLAVEGLRSHAASVRSQR